MGASPYSDPFFSTSRAISEATGALSKQADTADTDHERRCAHYAIEDLRTLQAYIAALETAGVAASSALLGLARNYPEAEEFAAGGAGFEAARKLDTALVEGTPLEELSQLLGQIKSSHKPAETEATER